MAVELKVPSVGDSIVEVQIGQWLKKEGDAVKTDEKVVELETDKANVEVFSPSTGRLLKLMKKPGEACRVGDVIATIEEGDGKAADAKAESKAPPAGVNGKQPTSGDAKLNQAEPKAPAGDVRVMPAAQRMLDENKLNASAVAATGPGGRVLKEDVAAHLEKPAAAAPAAPATSTSTAVTASSAGSLAAGRTEEIVPMTMIRRRIAERLVQAQHTAAILTTFNEVDMSSIMELRKQFQDVFVKKYGVKLGFMSFFVKAVIDGLKASPAINAEIRGTDVVYRNYFDIGVAIGGGKGLVVPIIRNAERLSFAEVEVKIGEYAKKAQENKLAPDDLNGGTFSISNGGVYGSLLSTPILNPPQSGILGMHSIQERPVASNGQVVIRPMMYLALSYDHRIVDGKEAVTFLKRIKDVIENPTRILLEV